MSSDKTVADMFAEATAADQAKRGGRAPLEMQSPPIPVALPFSTEEAEQLTDRHLFTSGPVTVVHGLPEETVAMLFGKFSRAKGTLRANLYEMIVTGDLIVPAYGGIIDSERTRKFHERITVGYGHKSVADHAQVHFCLEGVSSIAERDFTSARLIAATSKSTRFVDFSTAQCVVPIEWPATLVPEYVAHCAELMTLYQVLVPMAVEAIRKMNDYRPEDGWKSKAGWEAATEKRALDMVRDVLPASVETSFGVTCSATGLREMLDKRQSSLDTHSFCHEWQAGEVDEISSYIRVAARAVVPTLLPNEKRRIPRQPRTSLPWISAGNHRARVNQPSVVNLYSIPDWSLVQRLTGVSVHKLVRQWILDRGHHMAPDRTSELAEYVFEITMPWAIQRDLGRHRMMTQLESILDPALGYGMDPMLADQRNGWFERVMGLRATGLMAADARLSKWAASGVQPEALQYACPFATNVKVVWKVSLRELVHILGLRTTKQGHPAYRAVVQDVAKAMKMADPTVAPLVDAVTNFEYVGLGRPG